MPPFTVLHVCMGNICRSPMAERLLALAVRERLARSGAGVDPETLLHSHSAGTGGWHAGEQMNPPAARQVHARGGRTEGFAARKLLSEHIDGADLVLTATDDLDDPWGRGDQCFSRVADEIEETVHPLATVLLP